MFVRHGDQGPDVRKLQEALAALGYQLRVDGDYGDSTQSAVDKFRQRNNLSVDTSQSVADYTFQKILAAAKDTLAVPAKLDNSVIPEDWMPPSTKMKGIIVHWTAGGPTASGLDRSHYHFLIQADGTVVRGTHPVTANESASDGDYAAHTKGCNTGFIGVSLCGMVGAKEPSFSGKFPINQVQWKKLAQVLAVLCRRYALLVRPDTVLSHSEVQDTLKKPQNGKIDINWLPWNTDIRGSHKVGDLFRAKTRQILQED